MSKDKTLVLVRHGPGPDDDRVVSWATQAGLTVRNLRPCDGDSLPADIEGVAGTVIYGGIFFAFAHDEHPFLREEDAWIGRCLAAEVPMLGICQGAQQIAHHLGAPVGPLPDGRGEFGSYEITPTEAGAELFPLGLHVPQAHYHGFGLPDGAEHLARSTLFDIQAARFAPRAYGFQFHPEVTPAIFARWQDRARELYDRPGAQTRAEQDEALRAHEAALDAWFRGFLNGLFDGGS